MRKPHRIALTVVGTALALVVGCKGGEEKDAAAEAAKKAQEQAAAELKQPVALISAYLPYVRPSEDKDRYLPKRRPDEERATAFAANEIRHAANKARQALRGDTPVVKDLTAALADITKACAEAADTDAFKACVASVEKFDGVLKKSEGAVPGSTVKFPRVGPEAVNDEAKKDIASFLKAKGPGDAGKAYATKRGDASVSSADLSTACQSAMDEAAAAAQAFEKAEEPIRLIAVTRKMSMESQCGVLTAMETLKKDVNDCRKKAKTPDCKVVCAKAKQKVEDGIPAAAFLPLEKDVADICKE